MMEQRKRQRVALHVVFDLPVYEELMEYIELTLGTTKGGQSIAVQKAVKEMLERENEIPDVS